MPDAQTDAAPDPEPGLEPEPLDDIPAETVPAPPVPVEPVTFTYRCWRDGADPWTVRDFATLNESWAYSPASTSCVADIHGNQYSDLQAQAVAVAYEFLPQGLPQLELLYGPCAVADNRDQWQYLDAPTQAQKSYLEAQLMLCPERPYADEMRAVIAR